MALSALHWFRRDLRLSDNTALHRATQEADEVVPLYIISNWSESHLWTGPPRQEFLCQCLASLSRDIETLGGQLIFRQGPALEVLSKVLSEARIDALYFNRDPDPFGKQTEQTVEALCGELGIPCHAFKDIALHERQEILTNTGDPYRVFTPYSRKWLITDKPSPLPKPKQLSTPTGINSDPLPSLETWRLETSGISLPTAGANAATERLDQALANRLSTYQVHRDLPAIEGTSRLSQDLRFGTLSIRTIYAQVARALDSASSSADRENLTTYLKELAWREFYMQVLHHYPHVLELEFNENYRGLPWDEPGEAFEAWKDGQTGFPIVDAGMRELSSTGFMHNRVRMIVAMFLTKDLHLDWRLGEQFFMQSLLDGEIAANNGGWQWSAGTGADAAPYFRIQNPWTQSKRYDPDGTYVRHWIPELADVPAKPFFAPPSDGKPLAPGYPAPIVDHSAERLRTLAIFKRHLAEQR
jgi:deoxyribodipyrimidine photo-lyase